MQTTISDLLAFAAERPGFDPRNYSTLQDYRADYYPVLRQLRDARKLARACELRNIQTVTLNPSGRLTVDDRGNLEYCAGQYYCTEYRAAVAMALASALWAHWAPDCADANSIRKTARRELGRSIAARWFA